MRSSRLPVLAAVLAVLFFATPSNAGGSHGSGFGGSHGGFHGGGFGGFHGGSFHGGGFGGFHRGFGRGFFVRPFGGFHRGGFFHGFHRGGFIGGVCYDGFRTFYGVCPFYTVGVVPYASPAVVIVNGDWAGSYWDRLGGFHSAPPYAGAFVNSGEGYAPSEVIGVHARDPLPLWPVGVQPRGRDGRLR